MFLGKEIYFVEQDELCNIDIDTEKQIKISERIVKLNKKDYARFLHTS